MKSWNILFFAIIISFLGISNAFAQSEAPIDKKEFKTDNKAAFKEAWSLVQEADEYYNLAISQSKISGVGQRKGAFRPARELYLEAYDYNPGVAALNYKIGICYMFVDDKYEGIKYLRKAYELDNYVTTDIHFWLGRAHHMVHEFERAIMEYESYRNKLTEKQKEKGEYLEVDKYIDECNNGRELVADPQRVIINNLGEAINSESDEYNSVLSSGDTLMYYSTRRPVGEKSERTLYDFKYTESILRARRVDKTWQPAEPMGKKINVGGKNTAVIGMSPSTHTLYIYDGNKSGGYGDIMFSEYDTEKQKWSKQKDFVKVINGSDSKETSMTFSPTRDTIYFISNREGSVGGKDIWYTYLWGKPGKTKKWQEPKNLGSTVNSPYNEEAVFLHPDGKNLYFSSKGHNTMGGYDVFKSVRDESGKWTDPVNLGYPINKADDEMFYISSENGRFGYYSALRDGGIGEKDIYKIIYLGEEKEMLLSYEDELIKGTLDSVYHIFFRDPLKLGIDSTLILKGIIKDKKTGDPVAAKLELIDPDESKVIASAVSKEDGKYKVRLSAKKEYGVEIVAKDFLVYIDVADLTKEESDELIIMDFELEKVEVGQKIVLENIYFETAKTTLKTESYEELDKLVEMLEQNETMRVEISGHTDNVGAFKYNQKLSEGRAKSVVDYLIGHGIAKERLEYAGYAFSQPIAPNDTESGRAKNRRVEFKILSVD